jgi:hypothetical protein
VDARRHGIWRRGQNRAGLNPSVVWALPPIPQSRERKQLPLTYLKAKWLLGFPISLLTRENLPLRPNLRSRSSPFVLFPQTLSELFTPDNREIPIEYP